MSLEMNRYRYSSNNSGGSWWLSDENWKALEQSGWDVKWYKDKVDIFTNKPHKNGRWLDALATEAFKKFISIESAIDEFEEVAQQDYYANGCNCCGRPHWISLAPVRDED